MTNNIISDKDKQVLVITNPNTTFKTTANLMKQITKKNNCIYMSIARPATKIIESFNEQKINIKKIGFIDCTGATIKENPTLICVAAPNALTEMSIALTKMTNSGEYHVLYIDSVSALLVNNDAKKVQKFIQYIINKASNMELRIIILAIDDKKSQEVITMLTQIMDRQMNF